MRASAERAEEHGPRPAATRRVRAIRWFGAAQLLAVGLLWVVLGVFVPAEIRLVPPGTHVRAWLVGPVVLIAVGSWLALGRPGRRSRPTVAFGFAVAALWGLLADHPLQGAIVVRLGERGLHSTDLAGLVLVTATAAVVDRSLRPRWSASRSSTA